MKPMSLVSLTAGKNRLAVGQAGVLAGLALISAVGCGSPAPAGKTHSGSLGTLKVTVIQAGGPQLPGGGTPRRPVTNAEIEVTSAGTILSSATDKAGVATIRLHSGSYLVSVSTCGSTGTRKVSVTAATTTSLTWLCPVP